jgi:hypothetical protein
LLLSSLKLHNFHIIRYWSCPYVPGIGVQVRYLYAQYSVAGVYVLGMMIVNQTHAGTASRGEPTPTGP